MIIIIIIIIITKSIMHKIFQNDIKVHFGKT